MQNENGTEFRQLEIAPTLATIERVQHDRGYRDSRGLFFIEGVRNFIEAVDHRFSVDTLLYSEKLLIQPLARKVVRKPKRAGVPFVRVFTRFSFVSDSPCRTLNRFGMRDNVIKTICRSWCKITSNRRCREVRQ